MINRMNARRIKKSRAFAPQRLPALPKKSNLPWPQWDGPIDLEIGCGVGLHPIRYATQNPKRLIIAIERTHEKFKRFAERLKHHEHLKNIYPIHADANHWVAKRVPANAIENIFILYPNPYPKAKHSNQRWAQMPFMGFLIERMRPQAQLWVASNIDGYCSEAKDILINHWNLDLIRDQILPKDFSPRTHFEKKYLARGEPCRELIFSKPSAWSIPESQNETVKTL